jgi:outer membrane protein OmpA-like peptidoglycan-associated protein
MELNIKVWKPKPKLKNQERQFLMVNDQWVIDNAELIRNGGFEIDESFEPIKEDYTQIERDYKEEMQSISKKNTENILPESNSESENTLFDFDQKEVEKETKTKIVKPKKSK